MKENAIHSVNVHYCKTKFCVLFVYRNTGYHIILIINAFTSDQAKLSVPETYTRTWSIYFFFSHPNFIKDKGTLKYET